jgi:glycosyltransferase involved in cell wall biosynthesis
MRVLSSAGRRPVAILLSTYNGENFLPDQLHSFLAQTHHDWTLHWRDDGSTDGTMRAVDQFATGLAAGRCHFQQVGGHRQVAHSFLNLLRAARQTGAVYFAFSDQDDVWLPDKLARGIAALDSVPPGHPALYCAHRIVVDSALWRTAEPAPLRRPPGFPAALTQNIAPGCTTMLNRAAADLVLASAPQQTVWHDWWCYIMVAAAGGQVLVDSMATVLYRQHANNHVGEPSGVIRRGIAALRRGPAPFMRLLRLHVGMLQARPELLPASTRTQLSTIASALNGSRFARLRVLALPGFKRQTLLETLVFRVWFLLG